MARMRGQAGSSQVGTAFNLPAVLFIVFLVLKLTDTIDWSWWWVTSPLWIPVLFVLVIASVVAAVTGINTALEKRRLRKIRIARHRW